MFKYIFYTFPFYYFRNGYRRLKRFVAWFPIIWRDEEWDSAYLLEIMRFKISCMHKAMAKNARHVGYEKDVRDMMIAEELLKRMTFSNFYYDLAEELQNEQKKGKCNCPEEKWTTEKDPDSGYSILINTDCDYCKSMRKIWFKHEDVKEKEDKDFLFRHLRKHMRKWWD